MNHQNNAPTANGGGRKHKNDIVFIAALLAVVIAVGLIYLFCRAEGDTVTVTVDGKPFGTYSLAEDRTVEIRTGEGGEELNLLVIENGEASVVEASCPDGICAAHKPISREGESIVCLPHRVVITVKTSDANAPDVIV